MKKLGRNTLLMTLGIIFCIGFFTVKVCAERGTEFTIENRETMGYMTSGFQVNQLGIENTETERRVNSFSLPTVIYINGTEENGFTSWSYVPTEKSDNSQQDFNIREGSEAVQNEALSATEDPVFVGPDEAMNQIREGMKARKEVVTVYIECTPNVMADFYDRLNNWIAVNTGDPKEGDYIRWQFGEYKMETMGYTYEGSETCFYTVKLTFSYYDSAEQECAVDEEVARLVNSLNLREGTAYEKVYRIHKYLTENATYDYVNLNDEDYVLKYTAYAALVQKTAVCQGYSLAFYRLAMEAGINVRCISNPYLNHMWNIVEIGNVFYNCDATYDAGSTEVWENFLCGTRPTEEGYDYSFSSTHTAGGVLIPEEYSEYSISYVDYPCIQVVNYDIWYDYLVPIEGNESSACLVNEYGLCENCGMYYGIAGGNEDGILYLPKNLRIIEAEAFTNVKAKAVYVPAVCIEIGSRAFAGSPDLMYVVVYRDQNLNLAEDALEGTSAQIIYR